MVDNDYEEIQAKWNADDAQLAMLFDIKNNILNFINSREFEYLYWELRKLWIELDAKMTDTERKAFENSIKALDEKRVSVLNASLDKNEKEKEFYLLIVNLYRDLCRIMKKHGLYYREAEDDRGL